MNIPGVVPFPFPVLGIFPLAWEQQATHLVNRWIGLLQELERNKSKSARKWTYPGYVMPDDERLIAYTRRPDSKRWNGYDLQGEIKALGHVYRVPLDEIQNTDPRFQIGMVLAIRRHEDAWRFQVLMDALCTRSLPWTTEHIETLLTCMSQHLLSEWAQEQMSPGILGLWNADLHVTEQFVRSGGVLSPASITALKTIQNTYSAVCGPHPRFANLLGEELLALPYAGNSWGALAVEEINALPSAQRLAWMRLILYVESCEGSKPTARWLTAGKSLVDAIGAETFRAHVTRWFSAVTVPPPRPPNPYVHSPGIGTTRNIDILKGLTWLCADYSQPETARALADLAATCFKKAEGGPWAIRTANGAIWALSEMEGSEAIAQLSRLKLKVSARVAIVQVEKALEAVAKRSGLTKADLEDRNVPTYGFDAAGVRRETFGACQAVATINPLGEILVEWMGANSKTVKSPPTAIKQSHAAELKAFKADVAAAATMITTQKRRFDSFYLPGRLWTLRNWCDRFAAHPLLGNVALRLIWQFSDKEYQGEGIWSSERQDFVDVAGQPLLWLSEETEVRLWHPIGVSVERIVAWRDYLQQHQITQPFKQAHREVYLLTEAERQTTTYSNRFAAQLLKQHQMHSLAAQRGWRHQLHIVASDYRPPAIKVFPEFGLRAEFWIEGVGEPYSEDTTAAGAFLYIATDQVRFYRLNAPENHSDGGGYTTVQRGQILAPEVGLPLSEVPALLFSEVMRDVDLFVGVGSVGNDPVWQDGGPEGRDENTWLDYSFGVLSATALTRRDVLERLLPRLKIAARCTLQDRFLVVRGDLRTYKIHLGSGNVLMEPNDQYLCIVEARSTNATQNAMPFLPFEGDSRLALILSKAFLLAEDTRITDPTIIRQLQLA